ncbi:TVP38/TMEM64 family protein [Allofrancisella guangzhouensis]|uniref:TVP38/TMEM64 family membrane protein n=1 Tax=Allofrancisella guangzhouensis TaxID=594679 RepID=A0A0A8E3S6_9GAMM|nr:TVP38/TMEM64 family protein [Allofrancisella guangzhouensis]AJC48633.1 membrane protein [Allofrancisella guangzhouensis]MBK2027926.1 TVP38/TMEM64 family protein [Allofrancisella guangzhouensis]MBK2044829.1 TVP38/TMEM64 family protein [Allofrancisella guangzhouensis]MBK2046232.1 TVP38/TMEM64 family protein [Allofrancisella guangzhouensis]
MNKIKRYLPIIILIVGLVLFFAFGGQKYLTLAMIKQRYNSLLVWTHTHFWLSSLIFIVTYIIIVAFSVPGATVMTLLGGFLFGLFPGVVWVILGATIGSCLIFLAVKTAFGESLKTKASGSIEKLRNGFEDNAFNYLLTLRLIPIFPFFAINIACGALGIRLSTFFWATLIGIIPGSLIYTWVGTGLGFALQQDKELNMSVIFELQFILPIIGLAILSLVPVIYRKIKRA